MSTDELVCAEPFGSHKSRIVEDRVGELFVILCLPAAVTLMAVSFVFTVTTMEGIQTPAGEDVQ